VRSSYAATIALVRIHRREYLAGDEIPATQDYALKVNVIGSRGLSSPYSHAPACAPPTAAIVTVTPLPTGAKRGPRQAPPVLAYIRGQRLAASWSKHGSSLPFSRLASRTGTKTLLKLFLIYADGSGNPGDAFGFGVGVLRSYREVEERVQGTRAD
jgi:hypothetical protein